MDDSNFQKKLLNSWSPSGSLSQILQMSHSQPTSANVRNICFGRTTLKVIYWWRCLSTFMSLNSVLFCIFRQFPPLIDYGVLFKQSKMKMFWVPLLYWKFVRYLLLSSTKWVSDLVLPGRASSDSKSLHSAMPALFSAQECHKFSNCLWEMMTLPDTLEIFQ